MIVVQGALSADGCNYKGRGNRMRCLFRSLA